MSVKEKRSVTFEEPEPNLRSSEPNLDFGGSNSNNRITDSCNNIYRIDSRSRSRARSRSWSRFRVRRTKSHDAGLNEDRICGPQVGVKDDRYVVRMVRTGSRNSVRSLVRLFENRSMSEGRKSQVILLDERRLDIIIQPKLHTNELLDLVSSHFQLKEKRYFGLGFLDDTNHFNWLQGEKRVLDHEFPKKAGILILYFAIKFYVDTICFLRDVRTVELFYLNARQLIYTADVQCDAETVFVLAAHVLQAGCGDYVSDEKTKDHLRKLPVIPTYILKEHPSIAYCEERIICYYEKISGTSRGLAIVNYMTIVERLETYGIHYYDVKDKKNIPWWLGISHKGIAVYDKTDKTTPRKLFNWKSLENLYHRDKKFSIEVLCSKNRVSRNSRTFGGSNTEIHTWFASTQQLTKCIWSMAVVQHQFYLDSKQILGHMPASRSMSEIAADLCRSITSLPGSLGSDLSGSTSSPSLLSLSNSRYDLTIEQTDSLKAERVMYEALKARREALVEALRKKTEELKALCLQEGELTGRLPRDIPLSPGEQPPVFRRRVGTAFSLSIRNLQDTDQLSNELSKLELEVELQDQIVAAACRLASDKTVSKYVRKQRKQSYTKAVGKLKDMRKKLEDMRKPMGKYPNTVHHSGRSLDEDPTVKKNSHMRPVSSGKNIDSAHVDHNHRTRLSPSQSSPQLSAGSTSREGMAGRHHRRVPRTSEIYSNDYCDPDRRTNDSSTRHISLRLRFDGSHDSGFSSANNMYNVTSQRASHYESTDKLQSPAISEPGAISPLQSQLLREYGSRTLPFSRGAGNDPSQPTSSGPGLSSMHYGSLDRKRQNVRRVFYRDVSPIRWKLGQVGGSYEIGLKNLKGGRMYGDSSTPEGVEDSDHLQSVPPLSSVKQVKWHRAIGTLLQERSHRDTRKEGVTSPGSSSFFSDCCFKPATSEDPNQRRHQDAQKSQNHCAGVTEHPVDNAHSITPQPVMHTKERSLSPIQSQNFLPHQRTLSPSWFNKEHHTIQQQQQRVQHCQLSPMSPIQFQQSSTGFFYASPSAILKQNTPSLVPSSQYGYHGTSPASTRPTSLPGPTSQATGTLLTVTCLHPHIEVSKPYEISDFYRYSEKLRRKRIIDHYQRQLPGPEHMSRPSSPLSIESDGHSQNARSTYQDFTRPADQSVPFSNLNCLKQSSYGSHHPYTRSVPSPLSTLESYLLQNTSSSLSHHNQPLSPSSNCGSIYSFIGRNNSTIASSQDHQSVLQCPAYQIQQIHSAAKHSMYQAPQALTCKPIKAPAKNQPLITDQPPLTHQPPPTHQSSLTHELSPSHQPLPHTSHIPHPSHLSHTNPLSHINHHPHI